MDIYNQDGTIAAHYIYDSWGNTISIKDRLIGGREITDPNNIGILNQIRYRGYYLDTETGYYYLMSRYYNPEIGRFLNADLYTTTGQTVLSTNMFAYCENNPIIYSDSDGYLAGGAAAGLSLTPYFWEFLAALAAAVASINWMPILIGILVVTAVVVTAYVGYNVYQSTKAQPKTAAQADAEIRTKIKNRGSTHYWEAIRHNDFVEIGRALSFEEACNRVSNGEDVFAATITDANKLALACSFNPISHQRHGNGSVGYYPHFHLKKHSAHIFYL